MKMNGQGKSETIPKDLGQTSTGASYIQAKWYQSASEVE